MTDNLDNPILEAALQAHAAGFSIIPIKADGSKAPALNTWKKYQSERADVAQIKDWFAANPGLGMAVIGGAVSGEVEVLDFDDRNYFDRFQKRANQTGLSELLERITDGYFEMSPKGVHLIWRCSAYQGNQKLAMKPRIGHDGQPVFDEKTGKPVYDVTIETRGQGGYVIVAPSSGAVHPSGKPYSLITGGFDQVAEITAKEREAVLNLCRTLDEKPLEPEKDDSDFDGYKPDNKFSGDRPGDLFNKAQDWDIVFASTGWKRAFTSQGVDYWTRPGKNFGISASTGYEVEGRGRGYLYIFSTSAYPLEAGRCYSPFTAYALLQHGGDFKAASKALQGLGYGPKKAQKVKIDPNTGEILEDAPAASVATATASKKAEPVDIDLEDEGGFHTTDRGNGERLAHYYGPDLHYVNGWGWLAWDGRRWERDETFRVMALMKQVCDRIRIDEVKAADDKDRKKDLFKWSMTSESLKHLKAAIETARDEGSIPARTKDFDQAQYLFNCANGTLNLLTGELRDHDRADMVTKVSPVKYDPAATCPQWLKFLDMIYEGRQDLIDFVQKMAGYALTGSVIEQCFFILYGTGGNGKSILLLTLAKLLGEYAATANPETFMDRSGMGGQIRTDLASLQGARLVSIIETESGRSLAESHIKGFVAGDPIKCRFLRQDEFTFTPEGKIVMATNHKPRIKGQDEGIWRRIYLIPHLYRVPPELRDKNLGEKLITELPGILNWAIEGCKAWLKDGLNPPEIVKAATENYKAASDRLGDFFDKAFIRGPQTYKIKAIEAWEMYKLWTDNDTELPLKRSQFREALEERGAVWETGASNINYYKNIKRNPDFVTYLEAHSQESKNVLERINNLEAEGDTYQGEQVDPWM